MAGIEDWKELVESDMRRIVRSWVILIGAEVEASGMDEMSGEMVVKSKKEKDTKRFGGGGRK